MANENILQQLDNDAYVIGYDPKLKYKKNRTATGTAIISEEQSSEEAAKDNFPYSKALNGLANNSPSSVLDNIAYVKMNVEQLKNSLAKKFKEEQMMNQNPYYNPSLINSEYSDEEISYTSAITENGYNPFNDIGTLIDAGNDIEYSKKFEEQYDTIDGSVIPALINKLSDIARKLNTLQADFSKLYYDNPTITLQEAKDIDDAFIADLRIRERNNNTSTINYMTVAFDSILNKVISYNVFRENKRAIKCAKVIDSNDKPQATSNNMDIVQKLFDDVQEKLQLRSRGYQRQEDIEMIQKSLYNYYEKRKQLNDLYELFESNRRSKMLGRKIQEYAQRVINAIKNVSRVLMYNQNYLDEITELEREKYDIQKIYRSNK